MRRWTYGWGDELAVALLIGLGVAAGVTHASVFDVVAIVLGLAVFAALCGEAFSD